MGYLLDIQRWLPLLIAYEVKAPHADLCALADHLSLDPSRAWIYLAKVSRMEFIEIRAMVVLQIVSYFAAREKRVTNLSACHSTSAGMLSMFANTAMPSRDMATMLPRLAKSSRHLYGCL